MDWSKETVLITGGHGFKGSVLVRKLDSLGAKVAAPIYWFEEPHPDLIDDNLPRWDISVVEEVNTVFNLVKPTTVFHLAAQPIVSIAKDDPLPTWEANVAGTYYILEACRRHSVKRILVCSSDKAYGDSPAPYNEHLHYPKASFVYETSKACTDLITQSYFNTYSLPVVVTRATNVYGPGDFKWNRIVPGTIKSLWEGEIPTIRSVGDAVRDYIFVDDCIDGYIKLAEHAESFAGEAFNFSTGLPTPTGIIMQEIARLMGKTIIPKRSVNPTIEIQKQVASNQKARDYLKWKPTTDLHSGLSQTIPWYLTYLNSMKMPVSL